MVNITNTTQVSVFSITKGILQTNSVLNLKFRDSDYYRFEPRLKSLTSRNLPQIIIKTPTTDSEFLVLDHSDNSKDFNSTIILKMDSTAEDKFDTYVNAIIAEIESSESTYESSGYFNAAIDLDDTDKDLENDRSILVAIFSLTFDGTVSR